VRKWLEGSGIGTLFIAPGSPWENGYSESFNSRLREAKYLLEEHRKEHNERRPHSALGYSTPEKFYTEWLSQHGQDG
jgi:putative transposase